MKTRNTCIAAAILAIMGCSAAHAQVLGGTVDGALNGTLGGGLHDTSVLGHGGLNGSFGGELDTGPTLHSTIDRARGVAGHTTRRVRSVGANARNRAQSAVQRAQDIDPIVEASTTAGIEAGNKKQATPPASQPRRQKEKDTSKL